MDNEYLAQLERTLDDYLSRLKALEELVTKLPGVVYQPDPSRPPGVILEPGTTVDPAPLPAEAEEAA